MASSWKSWSDADSGIDAEFEVGVDIDLEIFERDIDKIDATSTAKAEEKSALPLDSSPLLAGRLR